MSKADTATELETQKNGDAVQNGSTPATHDDDIANVGVEGEPEDDEESDEYYEDEEADYEEDRQIVGDEDDEEDGDEEDGDEEEGEDGDEEGDEGKNTLTHLLLGNGNASAPVGGVGDEEDDEDEDDEYIVEDASAKSATKKRSFDEVADEEDSQATKKIKA